MPTEQKKPFSVDALNLHIQYLKQLPVDSSEYQERRAAMFNNGIIYYLNRVFLFTESQRRYLTVFRDQITNNTNKIRRAIEDRENRFIVFTQPVFCLDDRSLILDVKFDPGTRLHTCTIEKLQPKSYWGYPRTINEVINGIKRLTGNRRSSVTSRINSDIIRFLKDTFTFDLSQDQELTRRKDNIRNIASDITRAINSNRNFRIEFIYIPKPRPNPYPEQYRDLKIEVVLDRGSNEYVLKVEKFQ